MRESCPVCKKQKDCWTTYNGKLVCLDCWSALSNKDILDKASESDCSKYFEGWSSKDRTTAFFESFGRYVKEPNKRDIDTVYYIWLWACHDDHALVRTIDYTLKWAKMDLYTERERWKKTQK